MTLAQNGHCQTYTHNKKPSFGNNKFSFLSFKKWNETIGYKVAPIYLRYSCYIHGHNYYKFCFFFFCCFDHTCTESILFILRKDKIVHCQVRRRRLSLNFETMGAALIESEGREIRLAVSTTLLSSRALYAPALHSALSVSKCSQENFMMVAAAAAAALCCYRERDRWSASRNSEQLPRDRNKRGYITGTIFSLVQVLRHNANTFTVNSRLKCCKSFVTIDGKLIPTFRTTRIA